MTRRNGLETMRVLMISRSDACSVPGGDTVQMLETRAGLVRQGVHVDLGSARDAAAAAGYDIIHLFNWQQLEPILSLPGVGQARRPALVLSTIFWFHTGHWFDRAVATKGTWQAIGSGLGMARARRLYERWQRAKFRWGSEGRRLRSLLSVPARLLPNSHTEILHLEGVLGLHGELQPRCTIVPNGVMREMYESKPAPDMAFLERYGPQGFVLQAARLQAAKNQLGLMEALYDVDLPIVFAGQPSPYETEYVARCRDLAEQRGNVHFLGQVPAGALPGIYAAASVHALPSWRETPGLVSLEAAAAGCKIVSTSVGSAREYFGDHAWYCDPRDPDSIRQAVLQSLRSQGADALRERVLQHYTWEMAAKATLEAYRAALH